MSGRAFAFLAKTTRPNGLAMAALAFLLVAIVLATGATAPYVFKGTTLETEVAKQLRSTTGLRLTASDHARFSLIPSPRIEMSDLHLAGPDGALIVEAGMLEGEVRLLPLIVGRLELASVTLTRPKLTIDLDSAAVPADSTIGRALRGVAPGDGSARLGTVTLVDGTAVLKAAALAVLPRLFEINVTIDWPDIESPATLTGSLMVDQTAADVAAWVAQPSSLMRGETSPIALRIHAAPLELSANGDLVSMGPSVFHGHVALSAPSLPALLARLGESTRFIAPFANVALNSDATITIDHSGTMVDLPGLALDLDGNHYEGTLAYQSGLKPSLSGTLATETLTLAPFLSGEPSFADPQHRWRRTALAARDGNLVDLDLRVSATHLRIAPFTIDDAALSVMTRGARTEIALNEGKAYGGAVKGRVSIGIADGVVSARGAGSVTDADVAGVSWDALGRQVAAGTVSCAVNLESSGDSPAALMAHLQGWAKGSGRDGELSGLDLGGGLREIDAGRSEGGLAAVRRGHTPFSSLAFASHIVDGVAAVEDATLAGPDVAAAVTGSVDIGNRTLDLSATATPPASGGPARSTDLAVRIEGPFDAPVFAPHLAGVPPGRPLSAP